TVRAPLTTLLRTGALRTTVAIRAALTITLRTVARRATVAERLPRTITLRTIIGGTTVAKGLPLTRRLAVCVTSWPLIGVTKVRAPLLRALLSIAPLRALLCFTHGLCDLLGPF